jgi:hypothetical protein
MSYVEVRLDKVMRALFGGNAEGGVSVLHPYGPGLRHGQLDWEDAGHVSSAVSLVVRIPALPTNIALLHLSLLDMCTPVCLLNCS